MKRALSLSVLLSVIAVLSGCGSDKTSATAMNPITMPSDADAGVIKREEIPAGVFKLVKVESAYATDSHGAKYQSALDLATPGQPENNDKITHQMETTDLLKNLPANKVAWPYVTVQLPSEFQNGAFAEVGEYGVQWKSEQRSGRWWWNARSRRAHYVDSQFLFEKGTVEGRATYTAAPIPESKGILQVQGNALHVYMRYKVGGDLGGVAIVHATYQKQ